MVGRNGDLPWHIDPATINISKHWIIFIVMGVLCLVTVISSYIGILRQLRHSGPKGICIYTVRILLMAPGYSVSSWIALVAELGELNLVLELGRKLYECIVIFAFTQLLVAQLGGFERLGDHLTDDDCVHMPPLKWIVDKYSWTPATRFVRRSLSSVLQYAAVSLTIIPLTLISRLISHELFKIFNGLSTAVVGGSQILAMYGLIVFYHANHVTLEPIRPVQKLISIKLLLIATIWQQMIIHGLARFTNIFHDLADNSEAGFSAEQIADGVINGLIIGEMFLLSSYHHKVFPPGEDLALFFPLQRDRQAAVQLTSQSVESQSVVETELTKNAAPSPQATTEASLPDTAQVPPLEADVAPDADEVTSSPSRLRRLGSRLTGNWGSHVTGEQTQLTGCWHPSFPALRRFYHVFDITDILSFYRELKHNYRTTSTDNLDASNAHRYAVGFFRGREGPLTTPLAPPPS